MGEKLIEIVSEEIDASVTFFDPLPSLGSDFLCRGPEAQVGATPKRGSTVTGPTAPSPIRCGALLVDPLAPVRLVAVCI
jgi:hypothetical protein